MIEIKLIAICSLLSSVSYCQRPINLNTKATTTIYDSFPLAKFTKAPFFQDTLQANKDTVATFSGAIIFIKKDSCLYFRYNGNKWIQLLSSKLTYTSTLIY